MPSFGHSSNRGTYIKILVYLAPNDYMDFDFKIDFYDRKYINLKSKIRYNKLYGKNSIIINIMDILVLINSK